MNPKGFDTISWIVLVFAGLALLAPEGGDRVALGHLSRADNHLRAGEYGAAARHYPMAWERIPHASGRMSLLLRLAGAHLGRRETGMSEKMLLTAYAGLDRVERAESAAMMCETQSLKGEDASAEFWCEHALGLDETNRRARSSLARALESSERWGEAAYHWRLYLQYHGPEPEAHFRLGVIMLSIHPSEAKAWFEESLRSNGAWSERARIILDILDSDPQGAHEAAQLGLALLEMEEWPAALAQFERAIVLEPSYALAHAYRGHVLDLLDRPAGDSFALALSLEPNLVLGRYFRGRFYLEAGLPVQAREDFLTALSGDPNNPALGIDIALTYAMEGNYQRAEDWLAAAIERAPEDVALGLAAARFYVQRAYRVEDAGLPAVNRVLDLQPDSAEGWALRGWAWYLLGSNDLAEQDLARSLDLNPDDAMARARFGIVSMLLDRQDEACWHLNRAVDLDPLGPAGEWARAELASAGMGDCLR